MDFKGVKIAWLGHAGFHLQKDELNIYIDPYQMGRGHPDADVVLLTHNHYDHLSIEDLDRVAADRTVFLAPQDCFDALEDLRGEVRIVRAGDSVSLAGLAVEAVPAYNNDKRFHPKEKGWLGFVLDFDGVRIYHAGDTDRIPEMKSIKCDLALLPVSGTYVMTASEAAKAALDVGCEHAVPIHYGTFVGDRSDAEAFKKDASVKVTILEKAL
jgi:L-ascorbate metabolism protein UlaG (beta-lactamase superfamily)